MWKQSVCGTFASAIFAGVALATPFDDGNNAYQKGDYATALKIWTPLAEKGDKYAAYQLGMMYNFGRGVSVDLAAAAKWYLVAAEQGHAFAEDHLGELYFNGQGVSQDYVQAYLWLDLAEIHGDRDADADRHAAGAKLTSDQLAEAERPVQEWKPKQ